MSLSMIVRGAVWALVLVPVVSADQVVLKNGDTITGAIIKKDGGKLTIKSEFLGEVSMPWDAVTSVKSDEPVTVVLPGGESVAGKIATAGNNLEVAGPAGTKTAPLTTVDSIRNPAEQKTWERLQHPRLTELWTGYIDTGLALARGNARTDTLTTGFNASRVTKTDKIALTFSQIYGSSRVDGISATSANAIRGGWSYDRNITPRLFATVLNGYEYDEFQHLDLRMAIGAGLGFNAIKQPNTTLSFDGGPNYLRERFSTNLQRNSLEMNFGDNFVHKFSAATSLTQSARFFANLTNTGEYRFNFNVGMATTLKKWLSWQLTAGDRFVSNPLPGNQRNDLLVSAGFRITFAK